MAKSISIMLLLFNFSMFSLANESGFILNGETHVVYKDKIKIGKDHKEFIADQKKKLKMTRQPANIQEYKPFTENVVVILYEEDEFARCYYNSGFKAGYAQLSCIKK